MYVHITYEPVTLCTELWGVLVKCKFKILWCQRGSEELVLHAVIVSGQAVVYS